MADVSRQTQTIETITLELDQAEANALVAALRRVGGHPDRSPRGLIDGINRPLEDALGLGRYEASPHETDGAVYFEDEEG